MVFMRYLIRQRYMVSRSLVPILGICLAVYFCYHLVAGQRSYARLVSLEGQIAEVQRQYDTLKGQRLEIENRVKMMRPGSIDKDLLEEQAKAIIGYDYADEKVIILSE